MKLKHKSRFYLILKISVVLISYAYIAYRLRKYSALDFVPEEGKAIIILPVLLLMPLNWFIETLKWKLLTRELRKISLSTASKAVYIGITAAIFTPNRIGELAGRIVVFPPEKRGKAVLATATGSLAQLCVTVLSGLAASVLLFVLYEDKLPQILQTGNLWAGIILALTTLAVVWAFFDLKKLLRFVAGLRFMKKQRENLLIITTYPRKILLSALLYSFVRYCVFLFQFFLLFLAFGLDIHFAEAFVSVALTYFLMAALPGIPPAEIGIRGSVALFFAGLFSDNETGIIAASSLLWIINLALPALLGSVFLLRAKIKNPG